MRVYLVLVLFLLSCRSGVNKTTSEHYIPITGDWDYWCKDWDYYPLRRDFEAKLQLIPINIAMVGVYMRYTTEMGLVVEIWTKDYKTFNGVVTSYADSPKEFISDSRLQNVHFKKDYLDTALARKVYNGMKEVRVMPASDAINDWQLVCDGVYYDFQICTWGKYEEKLYNDPFSQPDSVVSARKMKAIIKNIDKSLDIDTMSFSIPFRPAGSESKKAVSICC